MKPNEKLSSIGTPIAEVEIDATLVYHLLENQHPDLTHLPIYLVDAGWDNAIGSPCTPTSDRRIWKSFSRNTTTR